MLHHLCHRQVPLIAIKAEWGKGNFSVLKWLSLHDVGGECLCKDTSNSFLWSILNIPTLLLTLCKLNVLCTKSIWLAPIYLSIANTDDVTIRLMSYILAVPGIKVEVDLLIFEALWSWHWQGMMQSRSVLTVSANPFFSILAMKVNGSCKHRLV